MLRLFSDGRRVARERERAPRAAGSPWRRQWRWHRVAVGAAAVAPLPWFDCSAGDNWRRPVWHFDIATRLQTWLVPGFPLFLIFLFIFFFSFLCFLSSLPSSLTCSISHLPLCLSVCLCISFSARLLYWLNLLRCRPSCLFPPPPPSPSLLQMKTETKISTIRYFASENATTETVALFDVYLSSIDSYWFMFTRLNICSTFFPHFSSIWFDFDSFRCLGISVWFCLFPLSLSLWFLLEYSSGWIRIVVISSARPLGSSPRLSFFFPFLFGFCIILVGVVISHWQQN